MKVEFKLPKAVKTKWVKALRSGDYKQGKGELKTVSGSDYNYETGEYENSETTFCCLGVARDIGLCTRKKPANKFDSCTEEFVNTAFLPKNVQDFLANKNDGASEDGGTSRRWGFEKIATWIEKNL